MSKQASELYEFGDFRLNIGERVIERLDGTQNGHLPEKAFQTLCFLVRNNGRLLTKKEIIDEVWPDSFVEENNLDKSVYAIRQFLGENRQTTHKYVETVYKHGYRFVSEVKRLADSGDTGPAAADPAISETRPLNEHTQSSDIAVSNHIVPEPLPTSPLYFRAALFGALLCTALIALWFSISSRRPAESPDLSSSGENAESLTSKAAGNGYGSSPAYDLYVRGKVKVASENREDTEAAIRLLEESVAMDPNFAQAFAQLARAYNTLAFKYSSDADRKRFHENAEVAIEKAIALKPDLAEAHFARGLILWTNTKRFPHQQAIQSYKRSLELDPRSDETHHQLSIVYAHIGLLDEAQRALNNALQINPNNTMARYRVGVYSAWQGKFDEAVTVFKTIPSDVSPMLIDRSMGELMVQTGRLAEAESLVDDYLGRYPQDEGGSFTSVKALVLAKAGKTKEAESAIRRANQIGSGYGHFHHTAYNIASAYSAMNKPDEAVEWLEKTAENGFPNYAYFQVDPNLNNIRTHPRFIRLMAKLKLQMEQFKALV